MQERAPLASGCSGGGGLGGRREKPSAIGVMVVAETGRIRPSPVSGEHAHWKAHLPSLPASQPPVWLVRGHGRAPASGIRKARSLEAVCGGSRLAVPPRGGSENVGAEGVTGGSAPQTADPQCVLCMNGDPAPEGCALSAQGYLSPQRRLTCPDRNSGPLQTGPWNSRNPELCCAQPAQRLRCGLEIWGARSGLADGGPDIQAQALTSWAVTLRLGF